jgi:hypothetical protein
MKTDLHCVATCILCCRGQTVITWQGLLILFGGGEYGRTFNDLWALDLKSLERDGGSERDRDRGSERDRDRGSERDSERDSGDRTTTPPRGWVMHRGWRQINPYTADAFAERCTQPLGRSGHACVLLEEHFMYMFGG